MIEGRKALHIHGAENFQHLVVGELPVRLERGALIEEAQRVAHCAVRLPGDVIERPLLDLKALRRRELPEVLRDGPDGDAVKIIPLAPGQDRHRDPVCLRRRENKDHIGGRLLERLKECVERPRREHVHLIDDVDAVPSLRRRVLHLIPDVPDVVDAVVGGGIDLLDIHGALLQNRAAHRALSAGISVHGVLAVHGARQNFRSARLSRPARPAEKVRVADPPGHDLIFQRHADGVLTLDFIKGFRAPFAVESYI